jgi:AraC-like DNA-binding protein
MGWISAIFVHKAIDAAARLGGISDGERAGLFRMAGVDAAAPADPRAMVSDADFFALLEHLAGAGGRMRGLGIETGAAMRCDDYGAFGLAFKAAPDILGSYRRVERFGRVVTSVANFRVECSGGSVLMEVVPGPAPRPGLTLCVELALAAAVALSREVGGEDVVPVAVCLRAETPMDDAGYRAHFRCPVHHGASRDAFEIDARQAARANRLSDAGMSRFFDAHLDEALGSIGDDRLLERRILDLVGPALSEGVPALDDVAARLGLSGRSLQRRLSRSGLVYRDLVSAARRDLSERLLRRTGYSLAEIAFLTGFADQSTFTRAFRRWYGITPAQYRRGA